MSVCITFVNSRLIMDPRVGNVIVENVFGQKKVI